MDKTTQDRVWSVLPKEFKEEVKELYDSGIKMMDIRPSASEIYANKLSALEGIFGIHNLTSDAEGEEMLYCDKSVVQSMAKSAIRSIQIHDYEGNTIASQNMATFNRGIKYTLESLFGPKCLPDDSSKLQASCRQVNVESLPQNPTENCDNKSHISADCNKPAESKFKVGDIAVVRGFKHPLLKSDGAIVTILSYYKKGDFYSCAIAPNVGIDIDAKYLEPYAEPKNKDSGFTRAESVKEARIASEESNLSNSSQDCDEWFDTIIKRGFRADRRCNIAVQMIKAMMSCPEIIDRISSAEADSLLDDILHDALYLTDNLIAECEKGADQ